MSTIYNQYEMVMGLEVHCELGTESKIFCGCTTEFGGEPNTHTCPICTGMPGTLPVLNEKVVDYAIRAGLALNCSITPFGKQDRKNYFYPDLPKAYQISQFDLPLCVGGHVDVELEDGTQSRIGITRIHIEEDAGKLIHDGAYGTTLVDYNRCGVPLIEIVTEPDFRSPEEGRAFLEKLRSTLVYAGVSECAMQKGQLRCDINISVRKKGEKEFGTRTEIKNMNSFAFAVKAMEYEFKRQVEAVERGEEIIQETRRYDEGSNTTISMRSKENAHDYRYFPDPDLMPIVITEEKVNDIREMLPEMPDKRRKRYVEEYNLPEYDANILTIEKPVSDFFENAIKHTKNIKAVSNWIMGDVLRITKEKNMEITELKFTGAQLAELVNLIDAGTISSTIGKKVFTEMFETAKDPKKIIEEKGLVQNSNEDEIRGMIVQVIEQNPQSIEDIRGGKTQAQGFLVGQVMKISRGKANPQVVQKILQEEIQNRL